MTPSVCVLHEVVQLFDDDAVGSCAEDAGRCLWIFAAIALPDRLVLVILTMARGVDCYVAGDAKDKRVFRFRHSF